MKSRPDTRVKILLAVIPALLLGGCPKPENLAVFESAWKEVPQRAAESVTIPSELQPQPPATGRPEVTDQRILDLSFEQAILLSLENNQDLRVREITPLIAGTFEALERGAFDPEFFAELELAGEKRMETSLDAMQTEVQENDRSLAVGVRQTLPTGTTVEGSITQSDNDTDGEPRQQIARLGVSVTQSLLRGAGPLINLVGVRQADLNTKASVYELRGVTESLLADTEIAYWEYVLAGQEIDIFEKSLAFARQQLDEIEQRIEVGTLPRIEAAAAQAEVARREQALIDARSSLEEKRLLLVRLLNPAGNGGLDIKINAISAPSVSPQPITDLEDRLQLAQRSRPDLAEAQLRMRQNRLQTIVTRNGLLPRLDLFISLGKTGYADSFDESFRNLDGGTYDAVAGLRLSSFLGNRRAEALDLAARASWQQAAEAVENLKQIVSLDVRLAFNEVERARQQIGATRTTRILQEETLQAEKERFDVGASTALLVAQAQRDLLASAIVEVEAVVNYRKARVNLYLAEGSLLERRGVSLTSPL